MVFDDHLPFLVTKKLGSSGDGHSVPTISRRTALGLLAILSTQLAAADGSDESTTTASESVSLTSTPAVGDLTRVQAVVEVDGQLKLNPDGKEVKKLPFKGTGQFVYDERVASIDSEHTVHIRHYQQADAGFKVGEDEVTSRLRDDRKYIGAKTTESQSMLFSPLGPLTRDELELIDIQGTTASFARLLPDREVASGETWTISNETAAILLRLDVVTDNKLTATLKAIEPELARGEISGSVSGSVGGVASDLEINAKFNFNREQGRITWLAMSIHENRAIGHAEPGFEVTARVRVEVTPRTSSDELADSVISTLPLTGEDGAMHLACTVAEGNLKLVLPRAWRVMIDRHDVTVMRFVDRGEMIAQCNISKLPDAAPGKQLAMESFQTDIQRSLAKNSPQFVEAKEFKSATGLRGLRVVVAGVASELPIQWTYYHLTDSKGRQAALVFTLDGKLVERFGAEDQTVVDACEFAAAPSEPRTAQKKK